MNPKSPTATNCGPEPQTPDSSCHKKPRTTCCSLDCIEQPRFFCGQLLTDQELMKLLGWSQDKFRLARFRQGWGVVCGLKVRCAPGPRCTSRIIVEPGYAVDCCGDDIVVCEEVSCDLGDACREEEAPCMDFSQENSDNTKEDPATFDRRDLPSGHKMLAVDLFIGYREEPSGPQATFGRDVCGQVARCEYGRMRETFTLNWRPAIGDGFSDLVAAEERWLQAYNGCIGVLYDFQKKFKSPLQLGTTKQKSARKTAWQGWRRWLLEWIERRPLQEFCFVRDWICKMPDVLEKKKEADLARLLFWLVQDRRNAFLRRTCHACDEDSRIRLARVYLQPGVQEHNRCCKIHWVDDRPPYRRELGLVKLPASMGSVNLGDLIWRRWEDAGAMLAGLNVNLNQELPLGSEYPPGSKWPETIEEIIKELDTHDLVFEIGDTLDVKTLDLGPPFGKRVVGFKFVSHRERHR